MLPVTLGVGQTQAGSKATTSVIQRAGVLGDKSAGYGVIYGMTPVERFPCSVKPYLLYVVKVCFEYPKEASHCTPSTVSAQAMDAASSLFEYTSGVIPGKISVTLYNGETFESVKG
jgi:hypothetical protein